MINFEVASSFHNSTLLKIITIGDLHGSSAWKTIDPERWDKMIFMGDYVDSFEYPDWEITRNLDDVLQLKRSCPDKVKLLWGNHDLAYYYGGHKRHYCSGFRANLLPTFYKLFTSNRDLFQAAFQVRNYLWTHAGVVNNWYLHALHDQVRIEDLNLAAALNRLIKEYYEPLFNVSSIRGGLNHDGGIFWADKSETMKDPLHGYHQIIGHTHARMIETVRFDELENTSVTYVDCLDYSIEFLELDI